MKNKKVKKSLQKLVSCALLIAIEVILGRWFAIRTPIVNISFAFVPLALSGMLYGPVYGFACGGLADFIGAMLFPQGPFFPGFSLTNALCGMTHGFILHQDLNVNQNRSRFLLRAIISVCIVNFGFQMCLNTYWLVLMGTVSKSYGALIATRVVKYLIMAPVQVAVIAVLRDALAKPILKLQRRQLSA